MLAMLGQPPRQHFEADTAQACITKVLSLELAFYIRY